MIELAKWNSAWPAPGPDQFVLSRTGGAVYRVTTSQFVRQGGSLTGKGKLKISWIRVRKVDVPDGATIHPFPRPPVPRTSEGVPAASAHSPVVPQPPRAIPQQPRLSAAARRRLKRRAREKQLPTMIMGDVPDIQREAVRGDNDRILRVPLLTEMLWRDPDDTSWRNAATRTPRLIRGWGRTDSIRVMVLKNPRMFNDEHALAADCYRSLWELAHPDPHPSNLSCLGGVSVGGRVPTMAHLDAIAKWNTVQDNFQPAQISMLDALVLRRGYVTDWAEDWGSGPAYAVGYLRGVLDMLVTIFRDEVGKRKLQSVREA